VAIPRARSRAASYAKRFVSVAANPRPRDITRLNRKMPRSEPDGTNIRPISSARSGQIHLPDQADLGRPDPFAKIFRFSPDPNHFRTHPVPFRTRGVSRSSRTLDAGCGGRRGAIDEQRQSGRRSRVVLTPRRWCQVGGAIR
jgi:hypothetical protein